MLFFLCLLEVQGGNEYLKSNNLKILKDLDIETAYITNDKFQEFYTNYSQKNGKHFLNNLSKGESYIPEINNILEKNDIPSVFLYMAMAESNFVLEAKSSKKAMGLWQFMPGTAKELGLKRDKYVDERMDVIKSTEAAVKYLSKLHNIFGSWYLAAISYNCGDGRLIEGITRATIDLYCKENDCTNNKTIQRYKKTLSNYERGRAKFKDVNAIYQEVKKWDLQPSLDHLLSEKKGASRQYVPAESRNYIKKIISLAMMNNNEKIATDTQAIFNKKLGESVSIIEVDGGTPLKKVAQLADISLVALKKLNPQIKKDTTPPGKNKTKIYIPTAKLFFYKVNFAQDDDSKKEEKINIVAKENETQEEKVDTQEKGIKAVYIVKKGDNLYRIAKNYNTTMDILAKQNNIDPRKIKPGDKIVIYEK